MPRKKTTSALLKVSEVATRLGLPERTVRHHAQTGAIPGAVETDGGHWRIPPESVEAYAQTLRSPSNAGPTLPLDEDARRVVAENTACFGTYSPMETVCGTCPLKQHCAGALATSLRAIARGLDVEAAARATEAEATEKTRRSLEEATRNVADVLGARTPKVSVGDVVRRKLRAPFDGTLCVRSGQPIPKGADLLYVAGEGLVSLPAASAAELAAIGEPPFVEAFDADDESSEPLG